MTTRKLVPTGDSRVRLFQVFDDAGKLIGTDEEPIPTPEEANEATIRSRMAPLLAASVAHQALPSPTVAQTAAQRQRDTRLTVALTKLALGQLDATDGT